MKYVDEYRDSELVDTIAERLRRITTSHWRIMEICGGQTHAILRFGIDELLPSGIELVHGPGCPVCVTPAALIDKACSIAVLDNVIFCSFGDMLRVPGSHADLLEVKSQGGDVRMVYSPLDAVTLARENPQREVVFFAIGFETTAPASAAAVHQAEQEKLSNFSILVSQVLVPPAIEAILSSTHNLVQGFLAPGHVCTVTGYEDYAALVRRFNVPIVVTGFEPLDIMHGIYLTIQQLESGRAEIENQYTRSVRPRGNEIARQMIERVFQAASFSWRGVGEIPRSGLRLREAYAQFDAERRFGMESYTTPDDPQCIAGAVLQGVRKPPDCSLFGSHCTPGHPVGAPMVSAEGACAAYYRYRRVPRRRSDNSQ